MSSSLKTFTVNFLCKLSKCAKDYCSTSSLHGLRHISQNGNSWIERFFWGIFCLSCTVMNVAMITMMWNRYNDSPTSTTIENTNHPINEVEFPAITICNLNKIHLSSAEKMIKKFASYGIEESVMSRFLRRLPQIYATREFKLENEEEIIQNISRVMDMLGYDLETFMFDLTQPCENLLVRCGWLGEEKNCSEMFRNIKTSEGFCCGFNWQGSSFRGYSNLWIRKDFKSREPDERKPIYVNEASTKTSGLTVVINSEEFEYFASVDSFFGVSVLLHRPIQYPDINVVKTYVQPTYDFLIRLRVTVIESSPNVRSLNARQRQCFFPDEIALEMHDCYSYEACSLEYKIKRYLQKCGCIPFYYPNIHKNRTCGLKDRQCLTGSREIGNVDAQLKDENWTVGYSNSCLPSCSSVRYDWLVQGNKIYHSEYASPIFKNDFNNKSVFNIFFEDNVCIKYRTESLMTWESLIASFGGIFGLCLGGSIISLFEIIYHFTYLFVKEDVKERKQEKNMIFIHDDTRKSTMLIKFNPSDFQIGKPFYLSPTIPAWIE